MSAELGTGVDAYGGLAAGGHIRMRPHITAAEAVAAFQRKLPGASASAREVHHPFWWAPLLVRTRGLFRRGDPGPGQRMDVLVNAVSGRGMIADFTPAGEGIGTEEWMELVDELRGDRGGPTRFEAERTARSLARTKVVKTVKLGMGVDISPVDDRGLHGVLKPNWLVSGANEKHSATILVDGLDSSHYIVRVEKLRG
jgi:hypothetical protein